MKHIKFCRIALILAFALITPCAVAAQDFSTVPDFPSDFTLIDPSQSSPSPSPSPVSPQKATTAATKTVDDTPTGPGSLAVVTLATLLGLAALGIIRWQSLTTSDHDSEG